MAVIGRLLLSGLSKIWAVIGPLFLSFLWEKAAKAIADWKAKRKIEADARAQREATEAAQTQAEREQVADQNRRIP